MNHGNEPGPDSQTQGSTTQVMKVATPEDAGTMSMAANCPHRYALGLDWTHIRVPVPRLMSVPSTKEMPVYAPPQGGVVVLRTYPGTVQPTNELGLQPSPPMVSTTVEACAIQEPPIASVPPPMVVSHVTPAGTVKPPPEPVKMEPPATHTPVQLPVIAHLHPSVRSTPPAPEQPTATLQASVAAENTFVLPTELPIAQEPLMAPSPPAKVELPPPPEPHQPTSVSVRDLENLRRQIEALEQQLREKNNGPELMPTQPR